MKKKINIPQKGAARKWAARLNELAKQAPPQDLIDKLNEAIVPMAASATNSKPEPVLE